MKSKNIFIHIAFCSILALIICYAPEVKAESVNCQYSFDKVTWVVGADVSYYYYNNNKYDLKGLQETLINSEKKSLHSDIVDLDYKDGAALSNSCKDLYYKVEPDLSQGLDIIWLSETKKDSYYEKASVRISNHTDSDDGEVSTRSECEKFFEGNASPGQLMGVQKNIFSGAVSDIMQCTSLDTCSVAEFERRYNLFDTAYGALKQQIDDGYSNYKGCTEVEATVSSVEQKAQELSEEAKQAIESYKQAVNESDVTDEEKDSVNEKGDDVVNKLDDMGEYTEVNYGVSQGKFGNEVSVDCHTYDDIMAVISEIYGWIRILAPLLLVIFGVLDFSKALLSNDQDMLKKATGNFVKRAIATVAIFFLPLIVNLLFDRMLEVEVKDQNGNVIKTNIFCDIDTNKTPLPDR